VGTDLSAFPNAAAFAPGRSVALPQPVLAGQYYRRMRAKLGAPKAIIAAAHKPARIVFHLLTTRQTYDESVFAQQEIQNNQRMHRRLQQQAKSYGFQLVEITAS